jgi:hypothetical protein
MEEIKSVKVGFTGTRYDLTKFQEEELDKIFKSINISEFHHGDCIGADEYAAKLVHKLQKNIKIICHPPVETSDRAYTDNIANEVREPKTYMKRNQDIIDESNLLVACSYSDVEVVRSGTWATIRKARKKKIPVIVVYPRSITSEVL